MLELQLEAEMMPVWSEELWLAHPEKQSSVINTHLIKKYTKQNTAEEIPQKPGNTWT